VRSKQRTFKINRKFVYSTCLFLVLLFRPLTAPASFTFPEEALSARAAYLINPSTGQVLYQREPNVPLPPASTTKIVTALVVLESAKLKESLRVGKSVVGVPSSKIGLRPGQSMSVEDLLYGTLLSSANDATVVLAEGLAGSVPQFAELMNQKARQAGAKNTQFTNPHGLTALGHFSTAKDMALIFNYAMKHPLFRKIVQTKSSSVDVVSAGKVQKVRHIPVRNHNRLLWNYDGAIGGKTGYTHAAQKCFVGGVERNGTTLIVSILGSRDLWGDTKRLLEYGFRVEENHKLAPVIVAVNNGQSAPQERPLSVLLSPEEERAIHSSSGYLVQVASFRERDRAESLQKRMLDVGYQAYTESVPVAAGGGITYRVRVGPYPQLQAAQDIAREIEDTSGFRPIILPAVEDTLERRS
jgi:D-alanyl-D-alanine carboxypeptidase